MRAASCLIALLIPAVLCGQGLEYVKAHYTKHEFQIPARDGTKLFTAVYTPKDTSKTYPILLTRTPYSLAPYGVDKYRTGLGPSDAFGTSGYIFVYQDVRGRWMSEGEFVHIRPHNPNKGPKDFDESSDTYDTIDWLLKNVKGHNGRVGMWGISYPGFYTVHGVLSRHPALKAASPQAPVTDMWQGDDFHHNGALFLPHAFNFLINIDKPGGHEPTKFVLPKFEHHTDSGYDFFLRMGPLANANEKYFKNASVFWNDMMKHSAYDEWWQSRNTRPHLKGIETAMMTVGGWFDAEDLFGPLRVYEAAEKGGAKAQNMLVMGPWYHGQWSNNEGEKLGYAEFNAKTSLYFREKIEFPFFEYHLKGAADPLLPEAYVFETGTNQWKEYQQWPPKEAQPVTFYMSEGGKLAMAGPTAGAAFDEYISDPAKPVPTSDYESIGMTREYMVGDQRHAARRTDVLVYQTEPLTEDTQFSGPINATLYVSTTGTDADFIVKVIDVFPDDYPDPVPNPAEKKMGGFQMMVRGEPFRGRFRNGFDKPAPFVPGQVAKIEFTLPDVNHVFRREHRLMIQVQSTWFPLIDRNPQKYMDISLAKDTDFQKATQRVYHEAGHASAVTLLRVKE
ncbi:MAG: CocE/NonD family hydrolase [Acidobacteriota bacterium]